MTHTITATEAKNRLGTVLRNVYAKGEHIIIEKSGIPVVVIVPTADWEARWTGKISSKLSAKIHQASRMTKAQQRIQADHKSKNREGGEE